MANKIHPFINLIERSLLVIVCLSVFKHTHIICSPWYSNTTTINKARNKKAYETSRGKKQEHRKRQQQQQQQKKQSQLECHSVLNGKSHHFGCMTWNAHVLKFMSSNIPTHTKKCPKISPEMPDKMESNANPCTVLHICIMHVLVLQ